MFPLSAVCFQSVVTYSHAFQFVTYHSWRKAVSLCSDSLELLTAPYGRLCLASVAFSPRGVITKAPEARLKRVAEVVLSKLPR